MKIFVDKKVALWQSALVERERGEKKNQCSPQKKEETMEQELCYLNIGTNELRFRCETYKINDNIDDLDYEGNFLIAYERQLHPWEENYYIDDIDRIWVAFPGKEDAEDYHAIEDRYSWTTPVYGKHGRDILEVVAI